MFTAGQIWVPAVQGVHTCTVHTLDNMNAPSPQDCFELAGGMFFYRRNRFFKTAGARLPNSLLTDSPHLEAALTQARDELPSVALHRYFHRSNTACCQASKYTEHAQIAQATSLSNRIHRSCIVKRGYACKHHRLAKSEEPRQLCVQIVKRCTWDEDRRSAQDTHRQQPVPICGANARGARQEAGGYATATGDTPQRCRVHASTHF